MKVTLPTRVQATVELSADELDFMLEMQLEELDRIEAQQPRPVPTRRPLTDREQEERWRHEDEAERMAAFMREDY